MSIKTWVAIGVIYVVLVFAVYGVITGNNPFQNDGFDEHGQHGNANVQLEEMSNNIGPTETNIAV